MRALLQRVSSANVVVDGEEIGAIDRGLLILVCGMHGDDETKPKQLASKISKLRIFPDDAGKMNKSIPNK